MEKLGTIRWVYMTKLLFIVECVFESERERERALLGYSDFRELCLC